MGPIARSIGSESVMKHTIISILLMICACGNDRNPPAPVGGSSEPPSSNCSAYLGCVKLCEDEACVEACAEATLAPVAACEADRCADLLSACDAGNVFACSELPMCGGYDPIATGSSSETSTSSGEGSSDAGTSSSSDTSGGTSGSSESSGDATSGSTSTSEGTTST